MATSRGKLSALASVHPFAAKQICGERSTADMSDREVDHALAEFQARGLLGGVAGKMIGKIPQLTRPVKTAADLENHGDEIRASFGAKYANPIPSMN